MSTPNIKLWKLLIDKNMNKKDLIEASGISTISVSKLVERQNIQTNVLCKICRVFNCNFGDIMEHIDNKGTY